MNDCIAYCLIRSKSVEMLRFHDINILTLEYNTNLVS
jgi:hypothetical protein